jgi:hypothetical protein
MCSIQPEVTAGHKSTHGTKLHSILCDASDVETGDIRLAILLRGVALKGDRGFIEAAVQELVCAAVALSGAGGEKK